MDINAILEVIAAVSALVFLWLNIRASRSLIGSFFKKYYSWMIIGTVFLFLGFAGDVFGEAVGLSENIVEFGHHLSLAIFGAMFVYASYILPKEAAERMDKKI
jgi:hypothetical protein